jgi:exodeoxyribonuclease V gamma subunit
MLAHQILQPGFIAFHSNRSENLAEIVIEWIKRHPLPALDEEIILVQSNGMAEWVKMELTRQTGVCAATRVELPSRFLWRTYRQILGRDAVPVESPLDKVPMIWRLMKLLPGLTELTEFAPIAGFLKEDEPERMLQLAARLADLFDQYQNYRADWLEAWEAGNDRLIMADGKSADLPDEQRWQPVLWRAVIAMLDEQQRQSIRPRLHQRVLAKLSTSAPQGKIAQRVIVFGMSQIPWMTLQALAALAPYSQIILAIPNPCQFYWGDIMDGRELLRSQRRRQPLREGVELSTLPLEDMHAHAHPLLAAWGRQGRDFVRQLDVFDDAERSRQQFDLARIDLFDETIEDDQTPLLKQVQNRIRDLTPLSEHEAPPIADDDRSIVFHSAHSRVRELEILHDQLLDLLANPDTYLNPRDIIVMVPDIEQMAPFIRAVFGLYKTNDARYIPYDIADMSAKASNPLIGAIDWLLSLPEQRCTMSELVDLLELPAIAARFGIAQESLPRLTGWMAGAGIRWGLNEQHRHDLGLAACGEQNSAWFGLRRMLMGYASGQVPSLADGEIEPYAEVGGLEAELAGSLAHLLQSLVNWSNITSTPATPEDWIVRFRALLADIAKPESETDQQALDALHDGLFAWHSACEQSGFSNMVPIKVARAAWMEAIKTPNLNQRFRAGGVTFCTLMPMRAIPFEVVCLLGMNDGDYPRRSMRSDFDLMGLPGTSRPGDRSRRDDDRQLMLESLLSARRVFYVSWCGHSVRDNSEQPPSVLVSQLRDYLSSGWAPEVVSERTTAHPLQPFSRRYFEANSPLSTHAREWREIHQSTSNEAASAAPLTAFVPDVPLTINQLTHFLRKPVKAFFRKRLLVSFADELAENDDLECFSLDGLQEYGLIQTLLTTATADPAQESAGINRFLTQLRKSGALPFKGLGDIEQKSLRDTLHKMLIAWHEVQSGYPEPAERQSIRIQQGEVILEDWIDHLRRGVAEQSDQLAWLELDPGNLLEKSEKPLARPDKLLGPWIRSLAVAASGVIATGKLVGRDGTVTLSPMPQKLAQETLNLLLSLWLDGMNAPLPLPPKTAIAYLNEKNPAAQYEGGHMIRGEVDEPCMARIYPDYEALTESGRFEQLAREVYSPLFDWMEAHVTALFHESGEEGETA